MYKSISTDLEDGILIISINRPDKLNALNKTVIDDLAEAIEEIYVNKDIKAAILTGSGPKAFVAGADISEFTDLGVEGGLHLSKNGQDSVFNRIENCPKPVIAAVNGFALGGGCELAMACHFRLAADTAKFGQPEVNLGLIPGYGGTQRLTQLIGKGRAMEMLMTGQMISARQALEYGLVNAVTKPEQLLPQSKEILHNIIGKAPLAVSAVIRLCNVAALGEPSGLQQEIETFAKLFGTADAREGTAAFLAKRKPMFSGK